MASIVGYRGFGTESELRIRGRVLEREPPRVDPDDPLWRHVIDTLRRLETDEIPNARVLATHGGRSAVAMTDAEGYFEIRLPARNPAPGWHDVPLTVLEPSGGGGAIDGAARVLVPTSDAEFGVISDIDDTVLRSHVSNRLLFARAALLRTARARSPLAGVVELYRALEAGPDGHGRNPIFYVSLTAWNLYDVLEACLAVHDVPLGPLMLRDRGLNASVAPRDKVDRALELFALYPTLPFVLIGDSGQGDPESYLQVVRRAPGRVLAVYIRDVSPERRDREVHAVAGEVASYGVPMVLVGDSAAAARHARERGLITGAALDRVAAAVRAETG